ncbi:MAG TPA: hypothetical protein VHB98_02160 [Chloroflexota bacterium]|jgi:hypothetical protein|nr:hypothetical protein [Chloroflexota bacterium]
MTTSSRAGPVSRLPRTAAAWLPVPRLSDRADALALGAGAGVLLMLAALGAALVHIVEYHLGLAGPGSGLASVRFMLAHCPVRGGLLVVIVAATLTVLALLHELRSLSGRQRRLTLDARSLGVVVPASRDVMPRGAARLVALFVPILIGQLGVYALLARLWPMTFLMRMHGALMVMTVQGAAPLLLAHLVVAVVLATCTWRLEHRFTMLQAAIAAVRRLLAHALTAPRHSVLPLCPPVPRLSSYAGPAALSRPPPV